MALVIFASPLARKPDRRGSALLLTAFATIPLLAMVAFATDYGRICIAKAELQRAADAAALAGAQELSAAMAPASRLTPLEAEAQARAAAMEYAAMNTAFGKPLKLQEADIEIGYLADPFAPGGQLDASDPEQFNAVRVRVRRDDDSNGSIPMFFARILGKDDADAKASATATFTAKVAGFKKPLGEGGPYIPMLPFTLDAETWQSAVNGQGPDEWTWDPDQQEMLPGSDGIPELNLYPQDTGSAANRGTVNIGARANSTSHVARQILYGISLEDWEFHDGSLTFDENGELFLNGDPGISAGFKDELDAIRGGTRIIPIFSKAEGNGDNCVYTITEWGGIRIVDVELTGHEKRVIVQAAEVVTAGTVSGPAAKSKFVRSRVWLSR